MHLDLINEQNALKFSEESMNKFIAVICMAISENNSILIDNIEDFEFSINFCNDDKIHQLNRDFRDKDRPTDVLTFAQYNDFNSEPMNFFLGDVIISTDTLIEQSKEYDETNEYTLKRLLIHGILHLLGYDHEKDNGEMLDFQDNLLEKFKSEGALIV